MAKRTVRFEVDDEATDEDVYDMVVRLGEAGFDTQVSREGSGRTMHVRVHDDELEVLRIVMFAVGCKVVRGRAVRTAFWLGPAAEGEL